MINIKRQKPSDDCLACLEKKVSHKCCDEELRQMFFDKCYLCEDNKLKNYQTEHLIPHQGDVNLKYDWNNLYYACPHCNNTKSSKYHPILDCTDFSTIITDTIRFKLLVKDSKLIEKVEIRAFKNDEKTQNTVDLLYDIHQGTTRHKQLESENLRNDIVDEIRKFRKYLHHYQQNGKKKLLNKIKRELGFKSKYLAFKIWVIKEDFNSNEELLNLLPQF